jgi:hypothetical protein
MGMFHEEEGIGTEALLALGLDLVLDVEGLGVAEPTEVGYPQDPVMAA